MGLIDRIKNVVLNLIGSGRQYASKNADTIDGYVDKVGDAVDKGTGNKYTEQITKARNATKKAIREE
ncbi:antitoxin [Millisia brevis]|uniref:antitoxin n=1 Tax=Millisia brevis TaxID=264148 RepID=UPI000832D74C|nr:antitoxin [Millisia brevis]